MGRICAVLLALLLAGCGSGGGGGGSVSSGTVAVDLTTQAPSVQTVIYGVQLTVRLPAGATVAADATTGEVAAGQLLVKDSAALASARYTPATATTPGSVVIMIADAAGFPPGDLATLLCHDPAAGGGVTRLRGSARETRTELS
ncbi:hypothetical protein LPW11_17020 [Geomonas sp. RF6]|uniref:hypothetical protein n=1 Tax=Geomonas sp. RF6 TaxID=2897342 RepID=UPI001E59F02F|nr:hypothetical protein [Geomonas sp. RF6]UFS69588.1 hypothetical protein LPW11_17020 [Geomonas sp. RF6]